MPGALLGDVRLGALGSVADGNGISSPNWKAGLLVDSLYIIVGFRPLTALTPRDDIHPGRRRNFPGTRCISGDIRGSFRGSTWAPTCPGASLGSTRNRR